MKTIPQFDLPVCGQVFNLSAERALDGERVIREQIAQREREREAAAYQEKMQKQLGLCPGFVGCYPPGSPEAPGRVTVQPSAVDDAVDYLKRRFHVGDVGWKRGLGMVVEILPRKRGNGLRARAVFRKLKAEQFELALEVTTET